MRQDFRFMDSRLSRFQYPRYVRITQEELPLPIRRLQAGCKQSCRATRHVTRAGSERAQGELLRDRIGDCADSTSLQILLDTSSRFGQPPTQSNMSALPKMLRPA